MTQEERQLLLVDLSTRLPYGVICKIENIENEYKLTNINVKDLEASFFINEYKGHRNEYVCILIQIKPYLRSMSSMTEEERKELVALCGIDYINEKVVDFGEFLCEGSPINIKNIYGLLDWLNKYHFDYRGLIENGLALEASKGMYK